jgi:hypothetical protein
VYEVVLVAVLSRLSAHGSIVGKAMTSRMDMGRRGA